MRDTLIHSRIESFTHLYSYCTRSHPEPYGGIAHNRCHCACANRVCMCMLLISSACWALLRAYSSSHLNMPHRTNTVHVRESYDTLTNTLAHAQTGCQSRLTLFGCRGCLVATPFQCHCRLPMTLLRLGNTLAARCTTGSTLAAAW
jgi:hypothetical protein